MFAYCGNNPVMLCDDCGEDAKNAIHNEVVDHAAAKYGLVSEEYLGRYGRCDLVDYGDLAVYEVKPISYMNIFGSYKNKLLNNQLDRYVQGLTYNYSKIEDLAVELRKKYTIIMVTHNMQQAARIADKTAFFLLGEIIEFDDTEKMFSAPSDKRTEDYITGRFG